MATEKSAMVILDLEQTMMKNKTRNQYIAAFIATIGGFIAGTALGWSSPANPMIKANPSAFGVITEDLAWIGACMPLGAMLGCPFTAGLVDKLGRKNMMLMMAVFTLIGWAMIILADATIWFCAGRLLTGFVSGSFSIIVPLYTSEIAEKEIRGTLGTYFQLQVTAGILFTYIVGPLCNSVFLLSSICAIIPMVYLSLMVFIPESPNFHLMKGNVEKARSSLRYFRGPYGNVDQELLSLQDSLAKTELERVPIMEAFQTTPAKRGLFIGLGIMFFQQFSGCNAVIFFATDIFKDAGSTIDPAVSTVVVGVMSVVATYISTLIVDRLGRKILLLSSITVMALCTLILGIFFYLKEITKDDNNSIVSSIGFVPLASLCLFIILFSIGFGPIPWMLVGEIFPAQIKGTACSIACMANWLYVFFVTKYFQTMVDTIHIYNTFWVFTLFCVLGTFFVIFIIPETKGKTIDEIQEILGGRNCCSPTSHVNGSSTTKTIQ